MSDIVERLRSGNVLTWQILAEAADEIEQLTAINEQALERGRAAIMQQTVLDHLQADNERLRVVIDLAELCPFHCRCQEAAAEIEQLRALIPASFVREFMAHRHFWAAHEINIVARKDAQEYRLEGDWLKEFCRALEQK